MELAEELYCVRWKGEAVNSEYDCSTVLYSIFTVHRRTVDVYSMGGLRHPSIVRQ